ncbi:hypothetical protein F8M41_022993 [Gigaspora margarita]|uniref:Uncharacterized protein n=1 Tax=Gigaspora margarita TaxID=4874 RepID=A0A8H4AE53_GIGMA|nr:hypothetical protein F8M41_022993 [Gigaspora margarita]
MPSYFTKDFDNAISIEENEEIKVETVAYLIAFKYSSTSPQNDKGPFGFATVYNILNIEDYINNNEQDLNQEQELTQEQIQREKQIQKELKKKGICSISEYKLFIFDILITNFIIILK